MKAQDAIATGRVLGGLLVGILSFGCSMVLALLAGGLAHAYIGYLAVPVGIVGTIVGVTAGGVMGGAFIGECVATALVAVVRRLGL